MRSYFFLLLIFILPSVGHAQILFSEVAWMGSDTNENAEWIELFNHDFNTEGPGQGVEGWTLTDGDDITITLHGTVGPMSLILLERTSDDTVPGVAAFQTYTGSLKNSGETLTLRDANGNVVAELAGGTDWANIGGSNQVPKKTAQQAQTKWVTGTPTPGAQNVEHDEVTSEDKTDTESATAQTSSLKKSSSGGGSTKSSSAKNIVAVPNPVLTLDFDAPKTVYVNETVHFEAGASGIGKTLIDSLVYTWNFGDTYTKKGKKVSHVFTRPGEYVVVLQGEFATHDEMIRHDIKVLPTAFEITRAANGDIVIQNKSPEEIDLHGFTLGIRKGFVFPRYSFVKGSGSLTVPRERVSDVPGFVVLLDTEGEAVAYEKVPPTQQVLNTGMALHKPSPQPLVSDSTPEEPKTDMSVEVGSNTYLAQDVPGSKTTVIQLGKDHALAEEAGFMYRVFQTLAGLFNF